MKQLLLSAILLSAVCLVAQNSEFKTMRLDSTKKLIKLTEKEKNDFPAMTVKEYVTVEYIAEGEEIAMYQTVHKKSVVINDKGVEYFNKVYIPASKILDIVDIKARSVSPSGKETYFDKTAVKEIDNLEDKGAYKIFALEGIEKGSTVEMLYTVKFNVTSNGKYLISSSQKTASINTYSVNPSFPILIKKLNSPVLVQDFLNSVPFNFEERGETVKSPIRVLREKNAHCMEGAILGAYVLSTHGHKPLILHLKTIKGDLDHVIALFKEEGLWGSLSKTNHGVLRYREPVYQSVRELVMSYFHEYFLDNGVKTLRQYSDPLNLSIFKNNWEVSEEDLWFIDLELDKIKHNDIASEKAFNNLRLADDIEIKMGKIVEFKPKKYNKKQS